MDDCIFCRIASGEISTNLAYSDEELVAFRDINPQAPHHLQIIPRRHIETISDLDAGDTELVGKMVLCAARLARELGFDGRGYRLVFNCRGDAGQEVYHIHLHLLGGRRLKWPPG